MHWLFQCNPKRYDLAAALEDDPALINEWSVGQGRNFISPDDRIFFWQTGPAACLLAVGHVTSPVFERESAFGRYAVGVGLDYKIVPPLTRVEVLQNETLGRFHAFTGSQGTNFLMREPEIVSELERIVKKRLVSCPSKSESGHSQRDLDTAIKQARQQVIGELRNLISQMDERAFEFLVGALLRKLGYKNIEVTRRSGDGGVDVRGILVAGGVANIKTCIQAKRQRSVGRPVVQNLRGSLSAHEAGLLVTSGNFTHEAAEEAKDPTRTPIALIDGRKLAELLLDHEIGVRQQKVTLYRLEPSDLSQEQLETVGEGDNE